MDPKNRIAGKKKQDPEKKRKKPRAGIKFQTTQHSIQHKTDSFHPLLKENIFKKSKLN
jgi:hypothetical protein